MTYDEIIRPKCCTYPNLYLHLLTEYCILHTYCKALQMYKTAHTPIGVRRCIITFALKFTRFHSATPFLVARCCCYDRIIMTAVHSFGISKRGVTFFPTVLPPFCLLFRMDSILHPTGFYAPLTSGTTDLAHALQHYMQLLWATTQ